MKNLSNKSFALVFPILLILLASYLIFKNYTPNTWLTGWDNLHPEFNFKLNIIRSVHAVWQEYQGVGLVGGMGHAADLPRQLILWGLSNLLQPNLLRYFWTFLMLLAGPLGVYFLIYKVLLKDSKRIVSATAAFTGGLFYLLNLATVQYFFTPFEAFISFYGFLPWFVGLGLKFLREGGKRNLLSFFIVSILGTTAFYIQTLFVVYILILSVFILEVIIKLRIEGIKRSILLSFVVFVVNAFWFLPVIYFSFTNSQVLLKAHQNLISSPETQIYNQSRGNLSDIALLRGYWFDYYDLDANRNLDYLYSTWIGHFENKNLERNGLLLFVIALIGSILAIFNKQSFLRISLPLAILLAYFMLATTNPPFGIFYSFLSDKIPLFSEMFRNSFTKWSAATAFLYSLGLASFVALVGRLLGKLSIASLAFVPIVFYLLFLFVKPAFLGNLI